MSASIQLEYPMFPAITLFCDAAPCVSGLHEDAATSSHYAATNDSVIMIGNNLEGSGRGLNGGTIPGFVWRYSEIPWKSSGEPVSWPRFELSSSRIQVRSVTATLTCSVSDISFRLTAQAFFNDRSGEGNHVSEVLS
jgi:hypothetical protein